MDEKDGRKVIRSTLSPSNTGVRLIMRMLSVSYLPEDCSSLVIYGAVLSTESSLLSRNFPVTAQNNRELKNDLAKNR